MALKGLLAADALLILVASGCRTDDAKPGEASQAGGDAAEAGGQAGATGTGGGGAGGGVIDAPVGLDAGMHDGDPVGLDAGMRDGDSGDSCVIRSECYTARSVFPLEIGDDWDWSQTCALTCGATVVTAVGYFTDALPAGACEDGTPPCTRSVWGLCPCPNDWAGFSGYGCSCENGRWRCAMITQPGAGMCRTPYQPDGSVVCPDD